MYRIFTKPEHSHEWLKAGEYESPAAAEADLARLTHAVPHRPARWVIRNHRGEITASVTIHPHDPGTPAPETFWCSQQVAAI